MKFNICVAIQIKSGELEQNQVLIQRVLKENPEFIELRFDYIDDTQKLTGDFVDKLLKIIRPKARTSSSRRWWRWQLRPGGDGAADMRRY